MNDSTIIDKLGGTGEVAQMCGISAQAVSQWRTDGIPKARRMYLELLRPDVFGASDETQTSQQEAA